MAFEIKQKAEWISMISLNDWKRWLALGALVVMGLIVCDAVISTLKTWYHDVIFSSSHKSTQQDDPKSVLLSLPSAHLFGDHQVVERINRYPVATFLKLEGVMNATSENASRAIIASQGARGKLYSVGDELASGQNVYAIVNNEVVLENEGRYEKLMLKRKPLVFQEKPHGLSF